MLYLKGGEIWYSAREITGRWEVTGTPPREAIDLAAKSASDSQAGEEPGANDSKAKTGKIPEIVVSTVPAELIATDARSSSHPSKGQGCCTPPTHRASCSLPFIAGLLYTHLGEMVYGPETGWTVVQCRIGQATGGFRQYPARFGA